MPLLISIQAKGLFSKLTDFESGVAALQQQWQQLLKIPGRAVTEHRCGPWMRHLCNTSSSFTLSRLVPLRPYWSGLWRDTCVMVTHLVTRWGQAPFGHLAARRCTIPGWRATMNGMRGLLEDYRAPVWSTGISSVTFKERQFPRKYHCFGQWLPHLYTFH